MTNKYVYYKVIWQEYNYGPTYAYWEHKEEVMHSIFEAREFKACMEKHTGQIVELRKVTEITEIIE